MSAPSPDEFDLEELASLEQTFYAQGYADGHAHGRLHGLIEGRALGAEKGFELWEELGFYEGAAHVHAGAPDAKAAHHARALLTLLARFPRANPAPDAPDAEDIAALLRLVRARYKALCACVGVRARAHVALEGEEGEHVAGGGEEERGKGKRGAVWVVGAQAPGGEAGLSF